MHTGSWASIFAVAFRLHGLANLTSLMFCVDDSDGSTTNHTSAISISLELPPFFLSPLRFFFPCSFPMFYFTSFIVYLFFSSLSLSINLFQSHLRTRIFRTCHHMLTRLYLRKRTQPGLTSTSPAIEMSPPITYPTTRTFGHRAYRVGSRFQRENATVTNPLATSERLEQHLPPQMPVATAGRREQVALSQGSGASSGGEEDERSESMEGSEG